MVVSSLPADVSYLFPQKSTGRQPLTNTKRMQKYRQTTPNRDSSLLFCSKKYSRMTKTLTAIDDAKKADHEHTKGITSYSSLPRACLKNHSRHLHAPLCGIFSPHSVAVARYAALIRRKSPTNCDMQLT